MRFIYNFQWYLCDDEDIRKINARDIANKEAYVLFYEREK